MTDPEYVAWADQFGALLRDKCRQMMRAILATGWNTCATLFRDPADDDVWRLVYNNGVYTVENITEGSGDSVTLDLDALGVFE